jgi:biotin carboxyl carrier protein
LEDSPNMRSIREPIKRRQNQVIPNAKHEEPTKKHKLMKKNKIKNSDMITLVVDDVEYTTLSNKMHNSRKPYKPINPKVVTSFMPGNIQKVFVKKGQSVKEGAELCILEAMKMKNVIIAPADGSIKKLNIKEGDIVPKNHPLVEMA